MRQIKTKLAVNHDATPKFCKAGMMPRHQTVAGDTKI